MRIRFCLFFLFSTLFSDPIALFIPPEGWECVKPKNLPESIEIAFLKKGLIRFSPSLNLSKEKVSVTFKEYLRSVKKLHERDLKVEWNDLGEFSCGAGKGNLADIRTPSAGGELRMLQAIIMKDGWAFILTGAAKREDFPAERGIFLKTMRSLTVVPDLFAAIPDEKKRRDLKKTYDSLNLCESEEERALRWKSLPGLLSEYETLGMYWLFLALREGHERIFSP